MFVSHPLANLRIHHLRLEQSRNGLMAVSTCEEDTILGSIGLTAFTMVNSTTRAA
jgi:hypothetical protein